jgi:hypothetical protein
MFLSFTAALHVVIGCGDQVSLADRIETERGRAKVREMEGDAPSSPGRKDGHRGPPSRLEITMEGAAPSAPVRFDAAATAGRPPPVR